MGYADGVLGGLRVADRTKVGMWMRNETKTIRLITSADRLESCAEPVGLLLECASDSPILNNYPNRIELPALIGNIDETKLRAYQLARRLLQDEPLFNGVQHLGIFEESLIGQLQYAYHVNHLYRAVTRTGTRVCHFNTASSWADGLEAIARMHSGTLKVVSPRSDIDRGNLIRSLVQSLSRSLKRIADGALSLQSLQEEWWAAMSRVDPFHRRSRLFRSERPTDHERQGIWFYSTSYTFTGIGMRYEPYFPGGLNYLVLNPLTGARKLKEGGHRFSRIYDFASVDMEPSRQEIATAARQIIDHVKRMPLAGEDDEARNLFLDSAWFRQFLKRLLPLGLFHLEIFKKWIAAVSPAALVVGNPVWEGYALHAARREGVPTGLLQHGILGDFCQFSDPPVDSYVVRGKFWSDFLSAAARAKSVILNPPDEQSLFPQEPVSDEAKHILFITVNYHAGLPVLHLADLDDIVFVLLRAAAESGRELVVRVHPNERVGAYKSIVNRVLRQHGLNARVSYSQGPGLNEVVRNAIVAVTHASTVFLDCLRHGVPIVSFAWHDFSYMKNIREYGAFHFGETLGHMEHLIREGVAGRLKADSRLIGDFLAPTGAEELTRYFAALSAESSRCTIAEIDKNAASYPCSSPG